jgi:hypothetical protein
MRAIAGNLEAWTAMWVAEPARRDGTVVIDTGVIDTGPINAGATGTAHGDRRANIPQGE